MAAAFPLGVIAVGLLSIIVVYLLFRIPALFWSTFKEADGSALIEALLAALATYSVVLVGVHNPRI